MKKANLVHKAVIGMTLLVSLAFFSNIAAASCKKDVSACSNDDQVNPQKLCSDYFLKTSSKPATTTTHCTNCNACVAGKDNCIKGASGCKKCDVENGKTKYYGTLCSGTSGSCSNGGGDYSCTE